MGGSSTWFRAFKAHGFTNQELGFTNDSIAQTPKIVIGECTGWVEYEVPSRSKQFPKLMLTKQKDCKFSTYNKKLDHCPICGTFLLWKNK